MLKILTLAFALLPLSAQGELVQNYIGKWTGTAKTSAKGNFKVTAVIRRAGENLKVSYVSKGASGSHSGTLIATPKGDGACYTSNLGASMNSPMPVPADICLDENGNAAITAMMTSGKALMSEDARTCRFSIQSPLGSANGVFKKVAAKRKKRSAE